MSYKFAEHHGNDEAEVYYQKYGRNHVITFDKDEAYEKADSMDNFNDHRAAMYARNESFRIAKELGLTYFLTLEDDYKEIDYRYADGKKLKMKPVVTFDRLFDDMIRFLDASGASSVAFCQGGDFIGGVEGGNYEKGLLRKAMNSFFFRTDRPVKFIGTINEDVTAYTLQSQNGKLFFSVTNMCVIQMLTQSQAGGMTDIYLDGGTYLKSIYSVIASPSCVKIGILHSKHSRIHHRVDWECCPPKILSGKWRKSSKGQTT